LSLAERFWSKVDKDGPIVRLELGPCWIWMASRMPKGYGHIRLEGRGSAMGYSHRVSWEMANGTIPDGLFVLHRCDNPPCVNPEHLFVGTLQENHADMMAKGRHRHGLKKLHARGTWRPSAKLSEDCVRSLRFAMAMSGCSQRRAARSLGVVQQTISRALSGVCWGGL
jgi:hypothetical protein